MAIPAYTVPLELHLYARRNGADEHLAEITADIPLHIDTTGPTKATVGDLGPALAEALRVAAAGFDTMDEEDDT